MYQKAKFYKLLSDIGEGLDSTDANLFESAHCKLGDMLGFKSENPHGDASPDPWWSVGDRLCFVFEDHSGGAAGKKLGAGKARQASGHRKWIQRNLPWLSSDAEIYSILITPCDVSDEETAIHLSDVVTLDLDLFRKWAKSALEALTEIRSQLHSAGDLDWRASAIESLAKRDATPTGFIRFLRRANSSSQ